MLVQRKSEIKFIFSLITLVEIIELCSSRGTSAKSNHISPRYKSRKNSLSKMSQIIPLGLPVYVEPSVSNQDEAFLESWNENLQSFSLTLMSQVITFCDQIIGKVNEEWHKTWEKRTWRDCCYVRKEWLNQQKTPTKKKRKVIYLSKI